MQIPSDQHSAIREYYQARDADDSYERDYGYGNPVAAAFFRLRDELIFGAVGAHFKDLSNLRVLEVGVGHGHELAKFSLLGIPQSNLSGVDLMDHRVARARAIYPAMQLSQQDATALSFADESFDIVCQFTCVMHATDPQTQRSIAAEMSRVTKSGGLIIWWDIAPELARAARMKRLGIIKRIFRRRRSTQPSIGDSSVSTPLRPISPAEVSSMFAGMPGACGYAGLDYNLWKAIWRRNKSLAERLWRRGVFPQHCFAAFSKQ